MEIFIDSIFESYTIAAVGKISSVIVESHLVLLIDYSTPASYRLNKRHSIRQLITACNRTGSQTSLGLRVR